MTSFEKASKIAEMSISDFDPDKIILKSSTVNKRRNWINAVYDLSEEFRERWKEAPWNWKSRCLRWVIRGCEVCNKEDHLFRLEAHHIKPRSKGGSDDFENIKSLHRKCHIKKHDPDKFGSNSEPKQQGGILKRYTTKRLMNELKKRGYDIKLVDLHNPKEINLC